MGLWVGLGTPYHDGLAVTMDVLDVMFVGFLVLAALATIEAMIRP